MGGRAGEDLETGQPVGKDLQGKGLDKDFGRDLEKDIDKGLDKDFEKDLDTIDEQIRRMKDKGARTILLGMDGQVELEPNQGIVTGMAAW